MIASLVLLYKVLSALHDRSIKTGSQLNGELFFFFLSLFSHEMKHFLATVAAMTALFFSSARTTELPKPDGAYDIEGEVNQPVDQTRTDPYSNASRAFMVSLFYPITTLPNPGANCSIPYMPPASAAILGQDYKDLHWPEGLYESLQLQVCNSSNSNRQAINGPVIIFEAGAGTSRLSYSAVVQSIASQRYIVGTFDHYPYETSIVEFPNGTIVKSPDADDESDGGSDDVDDDDDQSESGAEVTQYTADTAVRVKDITFVLDQMAAGSFDLGAKFAHSGLATSNQTSGLVDRLVQAPGIDVPRAGIMSHSLGGGCAASAMLQDGRFIGGLDVDGSLVALVRKASIVHS